MTPSIKQELRRFILAERKALSQEIWRDKSDRLCDRLADLLIFQNAKTILAYSSFRQEPDLNSLFVNYNNYHSWGLPRCVDRSLIWHLWDSQLPLHSGAFGILEPAADAPTLAPQDVDLILVPAVAVDERGYRLGYGGGFYDRMLADPRWQNIPTIGIVFDFAYVTKISIESWDRPLNAVCTESRYRSFT